MLAPSKIFRYKPMFERLGANSYLLIDKDANLRKKHLLRTKMNFLVAVFVTKKVL
jgi:hypothetical protein